ncbi:MAG: tRNA lysidine(34) synthetase TilS [Holosporales bacterium]|jgi:tRNA(Ile)-lysidine synthase|nr:tRNA lysidine(34) synthetase TilS [Holosporales bacterium]
MIIEKIDIPKRNFVVAVSGGADSLCLCLLAHEFSSKNDLEMVAVFVDHKLRDESSLEIIPIIDVFQKKGIKSEVLVWNHEKIIGNLEKRAREARYKLLTDFCRSINVGMLLTAHHALDQWETFFMRLSHGSGLTGLSCIKEKSKYEDIEIIRPLLNFSKIDIKETLHKKFGIKNYVHDPMNDDEKYERVKWRKAYDNFSRKYKLNLENISESIRKLQKAENFLEKTAETEYTNAFDENYLNLSVFKKLHCEIQYRVLRKIIFSNGYTGIVSYALLERFSKELSNEDGFKAFNIGGCIFRKDKNGKVKIYKEIRKSKKL